MNKIYSFHKKIGLVAIAALMLITGCTSTTVIRSYPDEADLYLNGEYVGQTPYVMTDTKPMFSCTSVRIEKESYLPFYSSICRDEEADVGAIIGGLIFWVPFAWALKYKPEHVYKLNPLEAPEVSKSTNDAENQNQSESDNDFDVLIKDE